MQQLDLNYPNVKHTLGFSGVNAIYHYLNKRLSREKIERYLRKWDSFTKFRQPKEPKQFNPIYCFYPRQLICVDLFSFHNQAQTNDGFAYILSAVDGFTKKAWCVPIKRKDATTVLRVMQALHQVVVGDFEKFVSDAGKEYYNKALKNYFAQHGIAMWHPKRLQHASFVERFQRTIEHKIARYLEHAKTTKFVDVLPSMVESYNNSYHRSIDMTPNQAEASVDNQLKIRGLNEIKYSKVKPKKPVYKIGQPVRILKESTRFSRGYDKKFTDEIFKIHKVNLKFPIPLYSVSNLEGDEVIIGDFMHYELSPVRL